MQCVRSAAPCGKPCVSQQTWLRECRVCFEDAYRECMAATLKNNKTNSLIGCTVLPSCLVDAVQWDKA